MIALTLAVLVALTQGRLVDNFKIVQGKETFKCSRPLQVCMIETVDALKKPAQIAQILRYDWTTDVETGWTKAAGKQ